MRFWQAGLAAVGGMMTVSVSHAEAGSFVFVAPPKVAVSTSFVVIAEIPPPKARSEPASPRSPLDRPPDYRWDAAPTVVSASIIAYGTRAVETPAKAPIPRFAQRRVTAHMAAATVIRTGIPGGAFPGATTVAASSAPGDPQPTAHRETPAPTQAAPEQAGSPEAAPPPGDAPLTTMQ